MGRNTDPWYRRRGGGRESVIRIGVIGYGYWGPNLVRNFTAVEGGRVTYVCDRRPERLKAVAATYPSITLTADIDELLRSPEVDAVAVATPVSTHFELARRALAAGKHVLVEKPLAESSEECRQLIEDAERRRLLLMVDHTFPYTGAVRKIKELIEGGQLGEIFYYDSVRVNLGLFQHDVSVVWDLAVHDLAILDYLLDERPEAISATGMSHIAGQPENIAYLTLFYPDNVIAHTHVNWLSPVKVRQTLIGGSDKMIVYDDLNPAEKIKVYDRGVMLETDPVGIYQMRVGYRSGDMWAPQFDRTEALSRLARHFIRCVNGEDQPVTSAESGWRIVRQMEAASRSMAEGGAQIPIGDL